MPSLNNSVLALKNVNNFLILTINLHCSGLPIPILEQQPYAPAPNRHGKHQTQRANLNKTEKSFSPIGSAINDNYDNLTA
jgi:hypothetical protein